MTLLSQVLSRLFLRSLPHRVSKFHHYERYASSLLFLKRFTIVIMLRNLDPDEGLCDGTKLIIRAFSNRVINAEIATRVHKQKRVFILRIILTSSESELRFVLRRRQFPISLAYCITTNKGQGQCLETVPLYHYLLKPFIAMFCFMLL